MFALDTGVPMDGKDTVQRLNERKEKLAHIHTYSAYIYTYIHTVHPYSTYIHTHAHTQSRGKESIKIELLQSKALGLYIYTSVPRIASTT